MVLTAAVKKWNLEMERKHTTGKIYGCVKLNISRVRIAVFKPSILCTNYLQSKIQVHKSPLDFNIIQYSPTNTVAHFMKVNYREVISIPY